MTAATKSTTTTTDLVRFLLARLDEDETRLKRMTRSEGAAESGGGMRSIGRLRADRTSKRQIVGLVQHLLVLRDQPSEKPVRDAAAQMLKCLAVPYADHAQYRDEWRPSSRM